MTGDIRNGTGSLHSGEGRADQPSGDERRDAARAESLDSLLSDSCERDLLVKRYLLGYLSEDEVEAFEERFVHDQGLLDELDEAERFIDGMRELANEGRLKQLEERSAFGDLAHRGPSSWAFRIAGAGAVLVATIALFLYVQLRDVQRELVQVTAPQVNMQIVDLEVTRAVSDAGEPASAVRLPAQPGWIVLAMGTSSAVAVERRARLLDSTDRVVAESTGLLPDDLGVVYWAIHTSMLRAGDYVAQVSTAESTTPEVRYLFRVMAPG